MRTRYRIGSNGEDVEVEAIALSDGAWRVTVDGMALEVRAQLRGDAVELSSGDGIVRAWVSRDGRRRWVSAPGIGEAVLEVVEGRRRGAEAIPDDLTSPMPGRIVQVLVASGDEVKKGDTLLVVEAMKTELAIVAPRDGHVARIDVAVGEMVKPGQILVELAPVTAPAPSE